MEVTMGHTVYSIDRETGFVEVVKSLRPYTPPSKRRTVNFGKVTIAPKVTIPLEEAAVMAENVIPMRRELSGIS